MLNIHVATHMVTLAGNNGIISWLDNKTTDVHSLLVHVGGTAAVGFLIWVAFKAKGAMAAIIVGGLSAGLFAYLVTDVNSVKTRLANEGNSNGAAVVSTHVPAPPPRH